MRVRVRMYRQGLGDCYLLTFGTGASARHALIDCGTLGATTTGHAIRDIVEDIRETTGGRLHLLVATHEHKDHLSGFASCEDEFAAMTIDRIWVAWTENPADGTARELKVYAKDLGLAAVAGLRALRTAEAEGRPGAAGLARRASEAETVLGFFGEPGELGGGDLAAGKFAPTIHAAMELVRTGFGAREADYLEPGTTVDVGDWLPGFRVYVLGPPRSRAAIADTGEHGDDLYPYPAGGLLAAAAGGRGDDEGPHGLESGEDRDAFAREVPFDLRHQIDDRAELARPRFHGGYADPGAAWRRIDADWLAYSAILALQLDNRTNNTSLVLAFERIADGKVLLFPADAQHGNWRSWSEPSELTWQVPGPAGGTATVRTRDLLRRTVFYKVGHHASHNATARENGLEKMEQPSLVAFIPLDRAVAKAKGWNTMPTRSLYKRLMEKCRGRVARSDIGWVTRAKEPEFASMFTPAEWQSFEANQTAAETAGTVSVKPLYVDYVLKA